MKTCNECKQLKSFDAFHKRKASKDGFQHRCIECLYEIQKAYRQTEKGKTDRKKEAEKYRTLHYEKLRENHKINCKKYRRSEKGREARYRDNVRRRSTEFKVDFTPHQRRKIIERDNWKCQICNQIVQDTLKNDDLKANIDHIIPISKGGNSEPSNLQTLCRKCNLTKADKVLI